VFQVNGTSATYVPDASKDCIFQVNGSGATYKPNATVDCLFQVNGSGIAWTPQSTVDCVFQVNGTSLAPFWHPSPSNNLTLTVNTSRHLMLFEKNLKRLESNGASADLVYRKLTLGSQDVTTRWYDKIFVSGTIKGSIQPKGYTDEVLTIGKTAKYEVTLFTSNPVQIDDEVEDTSGQTYTVSAVEEYWNLDRFSHYQCSLTKRTPYPIRPAASGTWSATVQAQSEICSWLTDNLTATNLTKDDGVTLAPFIVTFGKVDYSPEHVFFTKNVDLIFCVDQPSVDQAGDYEDTPITVYTTNKSGVTAATLQWKAEVELRALASTSPLGIYRGFQKITPAEQTATRINSVTYNLAYFRNVAATKYTLSLGSTADATTGWLQRIYSASTINMLFKRKGSSTMLNGVFRSAKYSVTGYTTSPMNVGDEVLAADGTTYAVHAVEKERYLGNLNYYVCELVQRELSHPPATSGIWHLDNSSVPAKTDVRYRHKLYVDTYLTAANMKLDDGTTNALTLTCFDGADLPLAQLFTSKSYDAVITIGKDTAEALYTSNRSPYAFIEPVPLTIYAVNKTGLTATNLVEQVEQEIRRIATTYPITTGISIRSIESIKNPEPIDVGGENLWSTTVTLKYKRANDDYTNSGATITWGPSATPTGTYTIPNIIEMPEEGTNKDAWLDIPGFNGSPSQGQGSKALDITFSCDLDVGNWKRPQASSSKTDKRAHDVIIDIWHNEGLTQAYHTLTLQTGGPSFNVRLIDYKVTPTAQGNILTVHFREHRTTSASSTYSSRLGMT
jgi:hypothetical protein